MLVHKKNMYHLLLAFMLYWSSEDPDQTTHPPPQTHLSQEAGKKYAPSPLVLYFPVSVRILSWAPKSSCCRRLKSISANATFAGWLSDLYSQKPPFCFSHSISSLIGLDRYFFGQYFRWRRWSFLKDSWCKTVTFPIFQWRQFLLWTILSIHQRLFWFNTIT